MGDDKEGFWQPGVRFFSRRDALGVEVHHMATWKDIQVAIDFLEFLKRGRIPGGVYIAEEDTEQFAAQDIDAAVRRKEMAVQIEGLRGDLKRDDADKTKAALARLVCEAAPMVGLDVITNKEGGRVR